ncbi:protein NRT1/ PTR FAMILY 2.13-like [Cryptomeria japonica]|uniref:protein NRT1/ PTR FAMILY 2.13-like n=1 Tax=Cryptomeria japonica TaxID=3369 RepID=UPI0025AD6726|nr:protein NRT1/ PTR FAMILY 2.13-like [Cryptomeria japonica]
MVIIVAVGVAIIVERKRLRAVNARVDSLSIVPLSAFWLHPQFIIIGAGEALQNVGRIDFFYCEFPETVRSPDTAFAGTSIAVAFYLSSLLVGIIHKNADWLTNNLNHSRLYYFYTLLCVMGVLNFAYFIPCARWYRYKAKTDSTQNMSTP